MPHEQNLRGILLNFFTVARTTVLHPSLPTNGYAQERIAQIVTQTHSPQPDFHLTGNNDRMRLLCQPTQMITLSSTHPPLTNGQKRRHSKWSL